MYQVRLHSVFVYGDAHCTCDQDNFAYLVMFYFSYSIMAKLQNQNYGYKKRYKILYQKWNNNYPRPETDLLSTQ